MRILTNFLDELAKVIDRRGPELRDAGLRIIGAVVNGMTGGLAEKAKEVASGAINMAKGMVDGVKGSGNQISVEGIQGDRWRHW